MEKPAIDVQESFQMKNEFEVKDELKKDDSTESSPKLANDGVEKADYSSKSQNKTSWADFLVFSSLSS